MNREKSTRFNHFYLHCFPEICTDAPKIIKDDKFYYQYKSCHNISNDCDVDLNKNKSKKGNAVDDTIFLNENNERKFETQNDATKVINNLNENDVYSIKTILNKPNQCNNKFTKGPIFIQTTNRLDRSGGEGDSATSSSDRPLKNSSATFIISILNSYVLMILMISVYVLYN